MVRGHLRLVQSSQGPDVGRSIANLIERELHALGRHTYLLDGDNIRHGLNKDLGFSDADRAEHIRRIAEVARLMVDAGLVVLAAFISPFRRDRQMARTLFEDREFIEVFVGAPLSDVERPDPTGIELRIDPTATSAQDAARLVVDEFRRRQIIRTAVGR